MRYHLRTLMIVLAIAPPVPGLLIWLMTPPDPNIPRDPASKKATADLRQLFLSATSLEIIEAGSTWTLRANSFQGESLKKLAGEATVVHVEVMDATMTVSVVVN